MDESHEDTQLDIIAYPSKHEPTNGKVRARVQRWKEHWVIHLIHLRGGMQSEFLNPPKRGVSLWGKLLFRLNSICPDFDKDAEACRKKWQSIYEEYKEDKITNVVSGNAHSYKCKWYGLVDGYMQDNAHVACYAQENNGHKDCDGVPDCSTPVTETIDTAMSPPFKKTKTDAHDFHGALLEIANSNRNLVEVVREAEREKLMVMKSMQESMTQLLEKLGAICGGKDASCV